MTEREAADRNVDTHALLGAAAAIIRALTADGPPSDDVWRTMGRDWSAAYGRYQNHERAALDWVSLTMPAVPGVERTVAAANAAGRASRISGAPVLSATSSVETLVSWLRWNDPNGEWWACADGDCEECPSCRPLTREDAWEVLAEMVRDELRA